MDDWFRFPLTPRAILLKSVMLEYVNSMLNYANSNVTWRQESELRTRIAQHLSGRVRAPDASLLRGMDVSMVAGVGRCPLAQVLRNSLAGHPPPTGCDTLSRVRIPDAVMLHVVVLGRYCDNVYDYLEEFCKVKSDIIYYKSI